MSEWKSRRHEKVISNEMAKARGIVLVDGKPSRNCPGCGIVLVYETCKGFEYSTQQSASCRLCAAKKMSIVVPDDRSRCCPCCGARITYKSDQSYRQAAKSERACRQCADDATRATTSSEEWRGWRSDTYRDKCDDPTSPVRKAYDMMQDACVNNNGTSKPEKMLGKALESLGFTSPSKVGRWHCDSVNHVTKVVVEHHGEWWHVRPGSRHERVIREDYGGIHPHSKMSIEEKWRRDCVKKESVEALGYTYIVVWHSDLPMILEWIASSQPSGNIR